MPVHKHKKGAVGDRACCRLQSDPDLTIGQNRPDLFDPRPCSLEPLLDEEAVGRFTRQCFKLRFEDAAMAGEPGEYGHKIVCDIAWLVIQGCADHQEAPGDDVRAVVDHGQAGRLIPALLIGPDQVVVVEWRTFDQIAPDQKIELGENEFSLLKVETTRASAATGSISKALSVACDACVMICPPLKPLPRHRHRPMHCRRDRLGKYRPPAAAHASSRRRLAPSRLP